jgi:hypothetical protein
MEDAESEKRITAEPKRTKRDRKKVSLLSSEYLTIYDDANNRKRQHPQSKLKKGKRDKAKESTMDMDMDMNSSSISSTSTTYQWIGDGTIGTKDGEKDRLFYNKFEIKVGNHPALIQTGDNILLSSDDTAEADVIDKTVVTRSIDVNDGEVADKTKLAMNELKPFVGKVVSMWEEGAATLSASTFHTGGRNDIVRYNDERRSKMKVLIQWYYKVRC